MDVHRDTDLEKFPVRISKMISNFFNMCILLHRLTYQENLMPIDITVDGERVTVPLTQPDLDRVCRGKDTFHDGFRSST